MRASVIRTLGGAVVGGEDAPVRTAAQLRERFDLDPEAFLLVPAPMRFSKKAPPPQTSVVFMKNCQVAMCVAKKGVTRAA